MAHQHRFRTDTTNEFFLKEGCHIVEILNQSNHSELSISRARVEKGTSTEPHLLTGTTEWYYILEGTGIMHIEEDQFRVNKGDVVFIPADATQWIENPENQDLLFLCICNPRWEAANYQSS